MTIQRIIDSAQAGAPFKHTPALIKLSGVNPRVVVAVHSANGRLKLLTYQAAAVEPAVSISRLCDSGLVGDPLIQSPAIAPVQTNGYVTAICDSDNNLKLTVWAIPADGQAITRMSDSGNQTLAIKQAPSIARLDANEVVTATVGHDERITLSRWGVASDLGGIARGGDSGNNGPLSSTPAFVVSLHTRLAAVAYATDEEHLSIQLYRLTSGIHGDPVIAANSGKRAAKIKGTLRLTRLHNNLFATAVCTQGDSLKVILWRYSADGDVIARCGATSDEQGERITATPDIAFLPTGQFVTAIRTQSGGLKLIRWRYSDDGETITKLDDTGPVDQTGEIASVPSLVVHDQPSQGHWLTTAIRTSSGNLQLIAWA